MEKVSLEIVSRKSQKTGKEYQALELTIGKWKKLIFVSDFELEYIKENAAL